MTDLQIVADPSTDVEALILDWAGTVVDFGSFAPTSIFVEAFARAYDFPVSLEEARQLQRRAADGAAAHRDLQRLLHLLRGLVAVLLAARQRLQDHRLRLDRDPGLRRQPPRRRRRAEHVLLQVAHRRVGHEGQAPAA